MRREETLFKLIRCTCIHTRAHACAGISINKHANVNMCRSNRLQNSGCCSSCSPSPSRLPGLVWAKTFHQSNHALSRLNYDGRICNGHSISVSILRTPSSHHHHKGFYFRHNSEPNSSASLISASNGSCCHEAFAPLQTGTCQGSPT